jgi:hypothetical protein
MSWAAIIVWLLLGGIAVAGLLIREAMLWRQGQDEPETYGDGQ